VADIRGSQSVGALANAIHWITRNPDRVRKWSNVRMGDDTRVTCLKSVRSDSGVESSPELRDLIVTQRGWGPSFAAEFRSKTSTGPILAGSSAANAT
jgi:hypothetical protein